MLLQGRPEREKRLKGVTEMKNENIIEALLEIESYLDEMYIREVPWSDEATKLLRMIENISAIEDTIYNWK